MRENFYDWVLMNLPTKTVVIATTLFGAVTFIEVIDVAIRITTGLIGIVLGVFGILHYFRKKKIHDLDEKIKQQQLYDIIESNKKKYERRKDN